MIEEQAPDTAGLPAMREVEVLVASVLPSFVVGYLVAVAHGAQDTMEVVCVLVVEVVRSEVGAASEPACPRVALEIPEVGVERRGVRVPGVNDDRYPGGVEVLADGGHPLAQSGRGLAEHSREVDRSLLDGTASREHSGVAAATILSFPQVGHELGGPVDRLDPGCE